MIQRNHFTLLTASIFILLKLQQNISIRSDSTVLFNENQREKKPIRMISMKIIFVFHQKKTPPRKWEKNIDDKVRSLNSTMQHIVCTVQQVNYIVFSFFDTEFSLIHTLTHQINRLVSTISPIFSKPSLGIPTITIT